MKVEGLINEVDVAIYRDTHKIRQYLLVLMI